MGRVLFSPSPMPLRRAPLEPGKSQRSTTATVDTVSAKSILADMSKTTNGAGLTMGGRAIEVERHALGKVRSGRVLRTKHWTARTVDSSVSSDPWPTKREALAELESLLAARAS